MNIKELIEKIGGRGRLETILSWRGKYASPSRISLPLEEVEAMARALLAVLDAKPTYYIHRVEARDSYGPEVDLRVFIYELDASKCKDDHGGEVIEVFTAPPAASVPDGWKLVPIKPTWGMLSADGCSKHHNGQECSHHENRKRIWSAMLAAAPAPGGVDG